MSVKLTIDNSLSSLSGLSVKQQRELRNILSYSEETLSRFHKGFSQVKKYLIDKKGFFPTGLLYLVLNYFRDTKQPVAIEDKRKLPRRSGKELTLSLGFTPYPEQIQAAQEAVRHSRGIITAPTGSGKSLIVALICRAFNVPTLIVVPSLGLKSQLTSSLKSWFGADVVGPFTKRGKQKHFIVVENVDALPSNKQMEGFDLVIIDEFHHAAAKTYRTLNQKAWNNIYHRIALTATPFRSRDNERLLLESVLAEIIYQIDYQTAVDNGFIVPMEAYYYDIPRTKLSGDPRKWASVYSELVVNNEIRNRLVSHILAQLNQAGKSSICLVKQVEHGNLLSGEGALYPYVKGENDDNREAVLAFNCGEYPVLVGTMGVLGEGIDTKPAEYVIMAGGGKSKNQAMQNCGRAFRKYPGKESAKIILFRDGSHKWMVDHFNAWKRYLKDEYGTVPAKLDLPEGLS